MMEPSSSGSGSGWVVEHLAGSAAELHGRDLPESTQRTIWVFEPDRPALVLGSTQADTDADAARCAAAGLDVVRRRSGGGAVLLVPEHMVWIDVVVPRGDPLWDDDVNVSFHWLGQAWARALADLGVTATVHRGALERTPWSRLVCFAGMGPGEVAAQSRKIVGLSQRRTRAAARFQSLVYVDGAEPASIVDVLAQPADPADRDQLRGALQRHIGTAPAKRSVVVAALLEHLPA